MVIIMVMGVLSLLNQALQDMDLFSHVILLNNITYKSKPILSMRSDFTSSGIFKMLSDAIKFL